MSVRTWEVLKSCYCHHVNQQVSLEAQVVYPSDILPDTMARVLSHRCTQGMSCNLDGRPSCMWAGTNPTIDPFRETP